MQKCVMGRGLSSVALAAAVVGAAMLAGCEGTPAGMQGAENTAASDDSADAAAESTSGSGAGTGASPAGGGSSAGAAPGSAGAGGDLAGAGAGGSVAGTGGRTGATPDAGRGAPPGDAGNGGDAAPPPPGSYVDLAPEPGEPFTMEGAKALNPPPPAGWSFYSVEETFCRDGSQAGVFIEHKDSDKLLIYFEGGGACTTPGFCHFNPMSINHVLTGDGETVIGTALAANPGRQQPGVYQYGMPTGIFDPTNAENPFRDWNKVYIPYCTGDVHFGTKKDGKVPGVAQPQMFVGHLNTREFVSRLVPTFADKVDRVIVTGASAGSFGAALNFSMIQDAFGDVSVDLIMDSGAPFEDDYWPICLQKSWRELWGLNDALPPDCARCFNEDGGGLLGLADFLQDKHPEASIAVISSIQDEVIRLFFAPGQDDCALVETADPFEITVGQVVGLTIFPADTYQAGLLGLRAKYEDTGRLATYYLGGYNSTLHQHTFRPRFFEMAAGNKTIAEFVRDFLDGTMQQIGP